MFLSKIIVKKKSNFLIFFLGGGFLSILDIFLKFIFLNFLFKDTIRFLLTTVSGIHLYLRWGQGSEDARMQGCKDARGQRSKGWGSIIYSAAGGRQHSTGIIIMENPG